MLSHFLKTALPVLGACLIASTTARASIIDFNDNPDNNYNYSLSPVISDGFVATGSTPFGTNIAVDGLGASNGTVHLDSWINGGNDSIWTLTRQDGGTFSLSQFDFATGEPFGIGGPASELMLTGTTADSNTILEQYSVSEGPFQTLQVNPDFTNLLSVTFDAYGAENRASYDNIVINASAIPEPASIALFGLGLLGMTSIRRRKTACYGPQLEGLLLCLTATMDWIKMKPKNSGANRP